MKILACAALAAFGLMPATEQAAPPTVEVGCGYSARWPTVVYDREFNERIRFHYSLCSGGYVRGDNMATGKSWRADIQQNGSMAGRDLDRAQWRYDANARLYTNLATGRTCAETTFRHVCGGGPSPAELRVQQSLKSLRSLAREWDR